MDRVLGEGVQADVKRQAKRYVFVTGGVVSSLGKGITAASLGRLLKARGLRVWIQKFDPYLNVDPGTMSPYQHGEVFVTDDGAETDLDLGHYERFVDENLSRDCEHHHRLDLLDHPPGARAATTSATRSRSSRTSPTRSSDGIRAVTTPTTSTSSSPRSAARSATSRACRSSRRSASSATTSAASNVCRPLHARAATSARPAS